MRNISLALAVALLVCGCRGTQPYTATDLQQVKIAYADLHPIYASFKTAFLRADGAGIVKWFKREQQACKLVDEIDKRDTIDPNVNLFQASIALDDMCDSIESAYVYWAKGHHLPYDKTIVPARPLEAFVSPDQDLEKVQQQIAHPADLS